MVFCWLTTVAAAFEDIERLERAIVKELQEEGKTHRERLLQNHKVNAMLAAIQERS